MYVCMMIFGVFAGVIVLLIVGGFLASRFYATWKNTKELMKKNDWPLDGEDFVEVGDESISIGNVSNPGSRTSIGNVSNPGSRTSIGNASNPGSHKCWSGVFNLLRRVVRGRSRRRKT